MLTGDGDEDDNVKTGSYQVIQWQWVQDFESDGGGFDPTQQPNGWEWGVPTSGPSSAYSGTKVWGTVLAGDYDNNAGWELNSGTFISRKNNPVLSFYQWYDMEDNRDGGNLKISVNNDNFTHISPVGGYPKIATWNNTGIPDQPCYSGLSGGWVLASFVLPVDSGQSFRLRWQFGSDQVNVRPGWYIDHVAGYGFEPGLTVSVTTTPIPCHGGMSEVTVTATGGTPPYSGTGTFFVAGGTHSFMVTDTGGKTGFSSVNIPEPPALTAAVLPTPTPCTGITSTLAYNAAGGTPPYSYAWSDGSSFSSIPDAIPAYYAVTVTDANNCFITADIILSQAPPTSVSITASANPVPPGTPAFFTATMTNEGTLPYFTWMVNSAVIGYPDPTFTYTPVDGDVVSCTMTNQEGCMVTSNTITMSVSGLPYIINLENIDILNNDELCYDATQTIYVAGNGSSFRVYSGGRVSLIAGTNIVFLPGSRVFSGGRLKAWITTNAEYCGNDIIAGPVVLKGNETQGSVVSVGNIRVYPNPTSGRLTIGLPSGAKGMAVVTVYNFLGETIQSASYPAAEIPEFDLSGVAEGIYFVNVSAPELSRTVKVTKTR